MVHEHGGRLGGVHGGAAADGQDDVGTEIQAHGRRFLAVGVGRVRAHLVVVLPGHMFVQGGLDGLPGATGGIGNGIGDHQDLAHALGDHVGQNGIYLGNGTHAKVGQGTGLLQKENFANINFLFPIRHVKTSVR